MTKSFNVVFAAIFVICTTGICEASDIYIAQNATGGNTGTDCADAHAYTFFNTSGNWASSPTAGKISPGTTVHLCGTFTGTAGTNELTTQGNGTSGHPITIQFESGALMQAPYWGT